jgi:integration host factor subunit beta
MTKSELVRKLAEANPRLHHHDVEVTVTLIFEQIAAALARGAGSSCAASGHFR